MIFPGRHPQPQCVIMARPVTPRLDEKLVFLIATGSSVNEAADSCGVSTRTIRRHLEKGKIKKEIQEARELITVQAAGKFASKYSAHIDNLDKIGLNPGVGAPSRVAASKTLLELGPRYRDACDLERRIRALEERIAAQGGEPLPAGEPLTTEGGAPSSPS